MLCQISAFTLEKPRCRLFTRLHDSNILFDELARESGNLANFLGGSIGLLGKGAWEVGKAAAPVVGKAINTVAPIAQEKATDAINYAAPIVQEKAKEAIDYATPLAQQKAADVGALAQQKATATVDHAASQAAVILQQLKDGSVGKTLANTLREAAGAIDRNGASPPPNRGISSLISPMVNPLATKMAKLEDEIRWAGIKSGTGIVGGLGILAILKKVAEPVERAASKFFFFAVLAGVGYGAVTYGPKAYQIYEIINK